MTSEEKNTTKERGRDNNLLMQDRNTIFHEKVKKRKKITIPMYIFFLISKDTINGPNHNKWVKIIMHLPKKHHWVYTTDY